MTDPRRRVLDPARLAAARRAAFAQNGPATARSAPARTRVAPVPFARVCEAYGLPAPVAEFRFCERRWRLDHAWPDARVALEVEGWGHRTHARYTQDLDKYNRLAEMGWRLVRCTPATRDTAATLDVVRAALETSPSPDPETRP